jgi:hypothetical protein
LAGERPAPPPSGSRDLMAGEASPKGSPLDTTVLARRTERIGEERFDELSGRFSRSGTGGVRNRRNGRPSGRDIYHQRMRREGCPFSRNDLKPGRKAREGGGVTFCKLELYVAPLCPVGHLPREGGDRLARLLSPISAICVLQQAEKRRSPHLRGRCPTGQRGARRSAMFRIWQRI